LFVGDAAKRTLAGSAHWAMPSFWKVLKKDSGRNFTPLVTPIRVIDKTTINHLATPHVFRLRHNSLLFCNLYMKMAPRRNARGPLLPYFFAACSFAAASG
jgi:hypothetical protein